MKITGLDELQKKLKKLQDNAKRLNGSQEVSLSKLLTPEFMRKFTKFSSAKAMFEAGGFEFESREEFDKIPRAQLDDFVRKNSRFATWQKMLREAGKGYIVKEMGF